MLRNSTNIQRQTSHFPRLHSIGLAVALACTWTQAQNLPTEDPKPLENQALVKSQKVESETANSSPSQEVSPPAPSATPQIHSTSPAVENKQAVTEPPQDLQNSEKTTNAQSQTPLPSDGEQTNAEQESGSDDGFAFHSGGVAVGVLTLDGLTWSRISWRPELSIGKLGVVFDLELFVDGNGKFSSRGWEFGTRDQILNTLYRKIYYIRWAHPGDPFYARIGALENMAFDAGGLIVNNFGNVALYPGQKPLGIHLQLNQLGNLNGSLETFTNSIEDWQHGGGVLGLRGSFSPLASLPLPIISELRLGASWVKDFNQFASIPDKDGDGCPDRLDDRPSDKSHCVRFVDSERMKDNGVSQEIIDQVDSLVRPDEERKSAEIRGDFEKSRPFALLGFDAVQPLIHTILLDWKVYSALAFPLDQDLPIADAFGSIPLGSSLKFFIFDLGLEYRYFQNYFNAGHFDAYYDMERVKFVQDAYLTKSELYWGIDRGVRKGIHGWLGVDLGGVLIVGGSYTHMFTDLKGAEDDRAYTGSAALGDMLVQLIPKISSAEVFYEKDKVGLGLNNEGKRDQFWELSTYSRYGYRIGVEMAQGMTLRIGSLVTHEYIEGQGLESRTNFTAETIFTF